MFITEVKDIDVLERRFNYEAYEKYLHGEIGYEELLSINGCTDHIMRVFRSKNNLDSRRTRIFKTTKHDFFNAIDAELKAYLLGFYFADGCVYDGHFSIKLNENDKEIVKLFRDTISPYIKITRCNQRKNKKTGYITKPMVGFDVYSPGLCNELSNIGMGGNKTYEASPDFTKIPDELFRHFIRGYFDGDGCVCKISTKRKYYTKSGEEKKCDVENFVFNIVSHKKEPIEEIIKIMNRLYGIKPNIIKTTGGQYLLEINKKEDFFKMKGILYTDATFFLKRKKEKYDSIVSNKTRMNKVVDKINYSTWEVIKTFKSLKDAGDEAGITPQGINVRIKKGLVIEGCIWKKR